MVLSLYKGYFPFLEFICPTVSLLFGTPLCVCGYGLPAGAFEKLRAALPFMRALFALASAEGCRELEISRAIFQGTFSPCQSGYYMSQGMTSVAYGHR